MVYKRFIPKILVSWDDSLGRFDSVLTREYEISRKIGDPLTQISVLQSNLVDEIMLINLSPSKMPEYVQLIEKVGTLLTTPLSVGGHISNKVECSQLIAAGADRLILGRNRLDSELSHFISHEFGQQASSCSIDFRENEIDRLVADSDFLVNQVEELGYGEIVLNCISRDGRRTGPDLDLLEVFTQQSKIPIVVSSGIGSVHHITQAFLQGASGVAAGTFLSNLDQSPKQIRAHLHANGIHIRYKN